jgi:hypothetical protein
LDRSTFQPFALLLLGVGVVAGGCSSSVEVPGSAPAGSQDRSAGDDAMGEISLSTPVLIASTLSGDAKSTASAPSAGCEPLSQAEGEAPFEPVSVDLDAARQEIVGVWLGQATAPSNWGISTWQVAIWFASDGSYVARGYDGVGNDYMEPHPTAFYYGDDVNCPALSRYRLLAAEPDTGINGQIDVPFYYGNGLCQTTWQGLLDGVQFDASGNRMRFSFGGGAQPIAYAMARQCVGVE